MNTTQNDKKKFDGKNLDGDLTGLNIFVVEDEVLIGMMLEDMLTDLGCKIVGPSINIDEALRTVQQPHIDIAILDLNLNGISALPVADVLHARKTPIVFSTGYGVGDNLREPYNKFPTLSKPYDIADLKRVLLDVLRASSR